MLGEYSHTIDAKGRLFIPARFREELGECFVIAKYADDCISVYSLAEWDKFVQKLLSQSDMKSLLTKRIIFPSAQEVVPDQQGRILIGAKLRAFASLEKEVTIIGMSNHAEIWAADRFDAYMEKCKGVSLLDLLGEENF